MTELLTRAPVVREPTMSAADAGAAGPGATVAAYVDLFAREERVGEPQWLGALRRGAMQRFGEIGFPTMKDEDWHFTNPAPVTSRMFAPVQGVRAVGITAAQIAPYLFDGAWQTLVFVNGVFAPGLSDQFPTSDAYTVGTLATNVADGPLSLERHFGGLADYHTNAFTALNTAFVRDGVFVEVRKNAVVERPIHVVHVTDGSVAGGLVSPRTLILAESHAEATIVESFVSISGATHLTNAVSEVYMAPGARVRHYKIQREALGVLHVGSIYAHQRQDSHFESFSFATGAALSRTNVATVLDGAHAHATMNGLYMVDGTQVVDHQTRIEHAKESCTSHEVYRGVLDGESHAVFNGKVYVRPDAQKTDGKQSNNNLLLSERARIDTKPQLEIFADDVKCTHGATIGRLDDTALFYLKSRGVGTEMARRLLTYAFAADVLEELTVDAVKERLEALTFERFAAVE